MTQISDIFVISSFSVCINHTHLIFINKPTLDASHSARNSKFRNLNFSLSTKLKQFSNLFGLSPSVRYKYQVRYAQSHLHLISVTHDPLHPLNLFFCSTGTQYRAQQQQSRISDELLIKSRAISTTLGMKQEMHRNTRSSPYTTPHKPSILQRHNATQPSTNTTLYELY